MSNENRITGWTVDTLHQHIQAIIDERDNRYQQLSQAQKEAVAAALTSAQQAVDKAEDISEKWRANANEWRSAMNDKDKLFLTKDVAKSYFILGLMASAVLISMVELFIRMIFK